MNKYLNKPTSIEGIKFDNKKEARRFSELMLLLKAGEIRNLKLQPQFTLQESYTATDGEKVRSIKYIADFSYEQLKKDAYGTEYWLTVVEDVKSPASKTPQYEIKKKLLRERFNLKITEI